MPVHTHPGEEFVSVLDGTNDVWEQDLGEPEVNGGYPGLAVVFRVHEIG
jgi:quercetin dioxygenase-like cupin family protein